MEIIVLLALFIVLAIAAHSWGVDSRDDLNSLEWQRRQQWPGFH